MPLTSAVAAGERADAGIAIDNAGTIDANTGIYAHAFGNADGPYSNAGIEIDNRGDIVSHGAVNAGAIYAVSTGNATGELQQRWHRHREQGRSRLGQQRYFC